MCIRDRCTVHRIFCRGITFDFRCGTLPKQTVCGSGGRGSLCFPQSLAWPVNRDSRASYHVFPSFSRLPIPFDRINCPSLTNVPQDQAPSTAPIARDVYKRQLLFSFLAVHWRLPPLPAQIRSPAFLFRLSVRDWNPGYQLWLIRSKFRPGWRLCGNG